MILLSKAVVFWRLLNTIGFNFERFGSSSTPTLRTRTLHNERKNCRVLQTALPLFIMVGLFHFSKTYLREREGVKCLIRCGPLKLFILNEKIVGTVKCHYHRNRRNWAKEIVQFNGAWNEMLGISLYFAKIIGNGLRVKQIKICVRMHTYACMWFSLPSDKKEGIGKIKDNYRLNQFGFV